MSYPTENITESTAVRIRKEMRNLASRGILSTKIKSEVNLFWWEVAVTGPEGSPYSEKKYLIRVHFPIDYPSKPPLLCMNTYIFHPNILSDDPCVEDAPHGKIGLDYLGSGWEKGLTISDVFQRLESVMRNPDLDPGLVVNQQAAILYTSDREMYEKRAKEKLRCEVKNSH